MDARPPSNVWLDDRLLVGDSPIEGAGLFFSADIPADTVVIELGGTLVSTPALGIKELQDRYEGHWVSALSARIAAL